MNQTLEHVRPSCQCTYLEPFLSQILLGKKCQGFFCEILLEDVEISSVIPIVTMKLLEILFTLVLEHGEYVTLCAEQV